MMLRQDDELDRMIADALDEEDRKLLSQFDEEPGYFQQAFGLFRGRLAWVIWLMYLVNIIGAAIAIWAAFKMFNTTDPVMTVRWAVLIIVSMNIGIFMKGGMGMQGQINRVLRELKRLELQVARRDAGRSDESELV